MDQASSALQEWAEHMEAKMEALQKNCEALDGRLSFLKGENRILKAKVESLETRTQLGSASTVASQGNAGGEENLLVDAIIDMPYSRMLADSMARLEEMYRLDDSQRDPFRSPTS